MFQLTRSQATACVPMDTKINRFASTMLTGQRWLKLEISDISDSKHRIYRPVSIYFRECHPLFINKVLYLFVTGMFFVFWTPGDPIMQ